MSSILCKQIRTTSRSVIRTHNRCCASKSFDYQYLEQSSEPTDKYQNDLPLLPIPSLQDSCTRYLAAVQPLVQSQNQFQDTQQHVEEFQRLIGKQLDHELRSRSNSIKDRTYFSDDWLESYLTHRLPIAIHMNPYLILRNETEEKYQHPALRATNLIVSSLRYRRSLIENKLKPEQFDLRFLDHLFASHRLPQPNEDSIVHYKESRHIVLMRRGRFFAFDALDQQGQLRSADEILRFVQGVYLLPAESTADPSICWFTGDSRDLWAEARQHLQSINRANQENLQKIESALLLVCLDAQTYDSNDASSQALGFLHGLYDLPTDQLESIANSEPIQLNRWFDKSMQLIVTSNGVAGACFEHSTSDGIVWQNVLTKIYNDSIANRFVDQLNEHPDDVRATELKFDLDERARHDLEAARKRFFKFASSVQMQVVDYKDMNRSYLKSKHVSPDFVFQLAFQMAYYKLFTGTGTTYEACSTGTFKLGRTETIRSATMETKAACKAMAWGEKKYTFPDLRQAIQKGSTKHQELSKLAAKGQGFDRHWFALKCLANKLHMDMPSIFTDPTHQKAYQFELSTSHLYGNRFVGAGYGPVIDNGFGLSYGFTDTGMSLNCSSFESQNATEFAQAFMESLQEINNVLERS